MGVDLRLLLFDCDLDGLHFSHTILDVRRDGNLWDVIDEFEQFPVPDDFTSFSCGNQEGCEETHYGNTAETPYGERLTYTTAKNLKGIALKPAAVAAYINALDDDAKVALY